MINMMDVTDVRTNLEALANKLDASDKHAAARLRDLSYAVGGGPYADAWAASDIHQLIKPDMIIEAYKTQRRTESVIAVIEWIRNSLIFAPLVVTWYGISQAVEQYSALIKADPGQITQPFLYLWQQGFGNRLQWWQTLGSLATIDFVLLAIVLVLTIAVYSLSNGIRLRREREAEELRSTLMHAIASAALCLTTRNWQQPTNFVTRFDQAIAHFDKVIGQLVGQISTLADRQKQDFQIFVDFKKDLAIIMSTVSSSVSELKASNEALRRSMNALVTPTQEISSKLGMLGTNAQENVNLLKKQVAGLEAVVKSQQQWGNDLRSVLSRLETTVKVGEDLANNVGTFTKKQIDLVAAMEKERFEQGQMANRVYVATSSLEKTVKQIDACSTELSGMNTYMNELVRRLATMRP